MSSSGQRPPEYRLRRVPVHQPRSEPMLFRLVPAAERWPMTRHEFLRGSLLGLGGVAGALGTAGCGGGGGGGDSGGGTPPVDTCPAPTTAALDEAAYRSYSAAQNRAHASRVNVLAFSGDGRYLASGGGSSGTAGNGNRDHTEVKLWAMPSGKLFGNVSDSLPTSGFRFSDDSRELYATTPAGFHTWAVDPTRLVGTITGPGGRAFVARNGGVKAASVILGPAAFTLRLAAWNLASGAKLFDVEDPLPKEPYDVAMNIASTVIAVSFVDGDLQLRESTGSRLLLHSLDAAAERPVTVFSPDGRLLASAGGRAFGRSEVNPAHGDTAISLWDVASGTLLRRLVGHGNRVNALAFSADGGLLASGSGGNSSSAGLPSFVDPANNPFPSVHDENSVRIWNTATGAPVQAFTGLAWRVNAVALSPDGHQVAAGSQDNTIKVWDTRDGSFIASLFDASALEPGKTANYASTTLANGQAAQRAYPTSAALPAAATCTCNCVAGSYVPKPPAQGGACALVCVCVPVSYPR